MPPRSADKRKLTRRSNSRDGTTPKWDRGGPPILQEAGALEEVTRVLEQDPENPKAVREKVVRRRRTRGERIARRLTIGVMIGVVTAGATVFLIGWFGSMRVADQEREGAPEPPTTSTSASEFADDLEIRAEAVRTIGRFLSTPDPGELTRWVLHPEALAPLMQDWYSRHPWQPVKNFKIIRCANQHGGTRPMVTAMVAVEGGKRLPFLLQKTGAGTKIDWAASVGYQPMELEEFIRNRPSKALPYRVRIRPDSSYLPPFTDPEIHTAFSLELLTYPRDRRIFRGYAVRGSDTHAMLSVLLSFKGESSAIVKLRYPNGGTGRPDVVEITEYVSGELYASDP